MKFDVIFSTATEGEFGRIVFELQNVSILAVVAALLGFPRKKYDNLLITISTSENEN